MIDATVKQFNLIFLMAAFLSGGILTLMIHFNGELAHYGGPMFASWTAHATGTVAAILMLAIVNIRRRPAVEGKPRAPLWAYLGGLSGALTVILSTYAVNSALALSGTLALGLAGQVLFSLAADRWGFFGLPRRMPDLRDLAAIVLIVSGSILIIMFGRGGL